MAFSTGPGKLRRMEAPSPTAGEDADWLAPRSSRRRRAVSLIALSALVTVVASLAYLHPLSVAKPRPMELAASPPVSTSALIDSGQVRNPPLAKTFQSPKMHYAIRFPVGWSVTPATQAWRGEWDTQGTPDVDRLDGSHVLFTGTSALLAQGQSPAEWIAWYLAVAWSNDCGVQEYMDFMGLTGLIDLNGCSSADAPGRAYAAAVVIGGRGYSFSMRGQADHALFVSMLRTIRFAP